MVKMHQITYDKTKPGISIIKLFTAVIYGFRNKLDRLSLNTRLDTINIKTRNTRKACQGPTL
jgi:hypothetical protein